MPAKLQDVLEHDRNTISFSGKNLLSELAIAEQKVEIR